MLVGALAATAACGRKPDPKAEAGRAPASRSEGPLRSRLDVTPAYVSADDGEGARHWKTVRAFYESNGWKPVWVPGRKPTPQAQALIAAVQKAEAEGLNAAQYDLPDEGTVAAAASWNPLKKGLADKEALDLDLRLCYAFVKYATHMASGRTDPATVDSHWFVTPRKIDAAAVMKQALDSGNVEQTLRSLAPQHPQYERLRETLARYRDIAARGGWPTLPEGLRLKPGSRGPQVALLRERLAASGDLAQREAPAPVASPAPTATPSAVFDAEVRAAVKRFQQRHGLNADGLLDRETLRALNVPVEERIEQLTLNMERWRWLPESLGERHILVNVPTYQLDVYENGQVVLPMRVVAGKKENPTPIFMDKMENVVFSPYWNVPPDIARKETIPAAMRDPGYLDRNDMELVNKASRVVSPWSVSWSAVEAGNYTFRQRPGEKNALGHVKFLFPNQFDVYLHDTPADSLFARTDRSFSHGCVRVEKPEELAEYVLRSQPEWTPERIQSAMHAGVEKWVTLKEPLPVYILYMTVWVDPDGAVQFREDIYGHDQKQQKLLPLLSPAPPRMAQVQPPTA